MYVATRNTVLIRIDKKSQKEQMEKTPGGILIPDQFQHMARFLQYGPIEQFGAGAKQAFPEIEIGDIALFHHTVEYGDKHLIDTLENGDEIRWLDGRFNMKTRNFDIFGIIKPNGDLIPSPIHLFLDKMMRPALAEIQHHLVVVDQAMWKESAYIKEMITDLEQQEKWLSESWSHRSEDQWISDEEMRGYEEAEKEILDMRKQRAFLGRQLNARCMFTANLLHIHEIMSRRLKVLPGDRMMVDERTMYPLEYGGVQYLLVTFDQVWAAKAQ